MATNVSMSLFVNPSEGMSASVGMSISEYEFVYEFDISNW